MAMTMELAPEARGYTHGEELAHVLTHGVGVGLAAAGLATLVARAAATGDGALLWCVTIYGASLVLLYLASTLYHAVLSPRAKHVFKVIDHSSIYLLIAGSYTPFLVMALGGSLGWTMMGVVWGVAAVGVGLEAFIVYRPRWLSALVYLAMGWLAVFVAQPLVDTLPSGGVALVLASGLAYTGGTAFYVAKRVRFMHAVWHVFVLAGSVLHFLAVLLYVVPGAR